MTLLESTIALELCSPGHGSVYVREDGQHAIVVSVGRGFVFFRRHEDGELMRVSRDAFVRRYRPMVSA